MNRQQQRIDMRDVIEASRSPWGEGAGTAVLPSGVADKLVAELWRLYDLEDALKELLQSDALDAAARGHLLRVLGVVG